MKAWGPWDTARVLLASYPFEITPRADKYTYDCSHLRDPRGALDKLFQGVPDGTDRVIQDWIRVDPRIGAIVKEVASLAHIHVVGGKEFYVQFGFIDRLGKWISPAIVELAAEEVSARGITVAVKHHGL